MEELCQGSVDTGFCGHGCWDGDARCLPNLPSRSSALESLWQVRGQKEGSPPHPDHLQVLELTAEVRLTAADARLQKRHQGQFHATLSEAGEIVGSQAISLQPRKPPLSHCCRGYLEYDQVTFVRCRSACYLQALYAPFLIRASW